LLSFEMSTGATALQEFRITDCPNLSGVGSDRCVPRQGSGKFYNLIIMTSDGGIQNGFLLGKGFKDPELTKHSINSWA
jgi:hypothetical protein